MAEKEQGQSERTQPPPPAAAAGASSPVHMAGLVALTFVHAGVGQVLGAIDLPVSREGHTDYPYIAGTSFKGALRDVARRRWGADPSDPDGKKPSNKERAVFGSTDESAGGLIVSDIRLLLLPVRSLEGAFRYLTCPHLIARFATDLKRAGGQPVFTGAEFDDGKSTKLGDNQAAVIDGTGNLFLEEFVFVRDARFKTAVREVATAVGPLLPQDRAGTLDVARRLTVVTDTAFAWYARSALPVRMRNALDPNTKTVKNGQLWSEEYIAPDTVMYVLLARRDATAVPEPLDAMQDLLEADGNFVQVGGNETVGHGWFQIAWPPKQAAGAS